AGSFIPLAEESQVIGSLGLRVLRDACGALGRWRDRGVALDLMLRVNISARQLRNGDLADQPSSAARTPAISGSPRELMPPPITTVSTSTLSTSTRTAEATFARNRCRTSIARSSPASAASKSA
ncbi:MAG: EAL domain-containing protein, partial [Candidatus Saccharibacteria bacterium]|nr:EAL domain-containing protein [Microbacteriaceae bacterium]